MSSLADIICGGPGEARFVERWSDRKVRRAEEVKAAVRAARESRHSIYLARLDVERAEGELRNHAQAAGRVDAERARFIRAEMKAQAQKAAIDAALRTVPALQPSRTRLILREVAERHGLAVVDLTGRSRRAMIVRARQEAMWRLKTDLNLSLPEIGRRLGGRDHTTALWGIRQHQARLDAEALCGDQQREQ